MARSYANAFSASGCDELIFGPISSHPDQIGLLAATVMDRYRARLSHSVIGLLLALAIHRIVYSGFESLQCGLDRIGQRWIVE